MGKFWKDSQDTVEDDYFFRNRTGGSLSGGKSIFHCVCFSAAPFFLLPYVCYFHTDKKIKSHTKVNLHSLHNLGLGVGGEFSQRA